MDNWTVCSASLNICERSLDKLYIDGSFIHQSVWSKGQSQQWWGLVR